MQMFLRRSDEFPDQSPQTMQREAIILDHLPQVKRLAHRICVKLPASIEMGDLISEGVIGLLDAVDRFNPSRGVKFKTYAEFRIRGAILDSLRSQDFASRSLRKKFRHIAGIRRDLEARLGRAPREDEIAETMGLSLEKYRQLIEKVGAMELGSISAQTAKENDYGDPMASIQLSDIVDRDPFCLLLKEEVRDLLMTHICTLPIRERLVVSLHYFDGLTLRNISKVLDLNESRISQIHAQAMMRLRAKISKNSCIL